MKITSKSVKQLAAVGLLGLGAGAYGLASSPRPDLTCTQGEQGACNRACGGTSFDCDYEAGICYCECGTGGPKAIYCC
jgi:hypothetical protein